MDTSTSVGHQYFLAEGSQSTRVHHTSISYVESSPTLLTLAPRYRAKPDVNMEKTNHFNIIKTMIDARLSLNILFP